MLLGPRAVPGTTAKVALLSVTVLGTMCNNIINVPLRSIAVDLGASVSAAVLCVSAFALVLAVAMPIAGWLGDRIGQKLTLVLSLVLMVAAQGLAALAPNLGVLVALRGVQGLACSAIPPMVMGLLGTFHPERRIEMMGAWAAANGIGQAIGPPIGGVVSDLFGWRMIFVLVAVGCAIVVVLLQLFVPSVPPRPSPLDLRGAFLLTSGVGLLLIAATTASQPGGRGLPTLVEALVGLLALLGYLLVSRGRATALIPLPVLFEIRFVRSNAAAFAQMFSLGTVLVALPLLFTGPLGMSVAAAGVLFFTLPAVMAFSAGLATRLSRRSGPRMILRSGLGLLVLASLLTGLVASAGTGVRTAVALSVMLLVLGLAMALVQTPAAAGATGSPAGRYGAAVGLFSMVRFSGSASAAAWVALTYPLGSMVLLFGGCTVLAAGSLLISFLGRDPGSMPVPSVNPTPDLG